MTGALKDRATSHDFVVKILSRGIDKPITVEGVMFDPHVDVNHADAVLCVGHPNAELLAANQGLAGHGSTISQHLSEWARQATDADSTTR